MGPDAENERPVPPSDAATWPVDLHAAADWITEDLAQRLYASRQDLAEAAVDDAALRPSIDAVSDEVLEIINDLRGIGTTLRVGPRRGSATAVGLLTARVADRCESAQALIAQSTQLTKSTHRLWAESARLRTDATALRRARRPREVV